MGYSVLHLLGASANFRYKSSLIILSFRVVRLLKPKLNNETKG